MGNPCGQVHMPNFPCRECDRIRGNRVDVIRAETVAEIPVEVSAHHDPEQFGEIKAPKSERIDVAKQALTAAERQRKFREKDPEGYKAWNRARMKERRRRSP